MQCLNCNNYTLNPKYCSRSCAAQQTNKTAKRLRTNKCKNCQSLILSSRMFCSDCKGKYRIVKEKAIPYKIKKDVKIIKMENVNEDTIGDLIYNQFHRSAAHNKIRLRAKNILKKMKINSCENCGYNKHIECAHIIPLSNFPLDTKVYVANAKANLIGLCPNCHWEFDKGLLPNLISKIERLNPAV